MNKKDIERLIFAALAIVAILVVIFVSASILAPPKRSDKGKTYDIKRLTKLEKNPLAECAK